MSIVFNKDDETPLDAATIEKMLEENSLLIQTIKSYQAQGRAAEALKYQQLLHRNLYFLANVADQSLAMELNDEAQTSNAPAQPIERNPTPPPPVHVPPTQPPQPAPQVYQSAPPQQHMQPPAQHPQHAYGGPPQHQHGYHGAQMHPHQQVYAQGPQMSYPVEQRSPHPHPGAPQGGMQMQQQQHHQQAPGAYQQGYPGAMSEHQMQYMPMQHMQPQPRPM
uniref:SSXT domain-containing protein n=1 Tax=Steinernema glaseri TaxID=37863 RepID=A0A1I7ZLV5_9BILA